MGNEITVGTVLRLGNFGIDRSWDNSSIQLDQTGSGFIDHYQTIGTATHELLDFANLADPGAFQFFNMDASNPCQVGIDVGGTFYPFLNLKAQRFVGGSDLGSSPVYALASGGPVNLNFSIVEE